MTPKPPSRIRFLGSWTKPRLGTIEFRGEGTGITLDVANRKSTVGEHKDQPGGRRLILTGALSRGPRDFLAADDTKGSPRLLFEDA